MQIMYTYPHPQTNCCYFLTMSLCKPEISLENQNLIFLFVDFPNLYQNVAMAPTLEYDARVLTCSKTYQNGMHVKMSDHDLHNYTEKHIKLFQ